tara:strand:+ start:110 stop:817 length:708 start_codon:yes stop_codon:yes gene_type:complete
LNIVLLTTHTTHHLYFARELNKSYKINAIAIEKSAIKPPFEVDHQFEIKRNSYESDFLLETGDDFEKICPTRSFTNINSPNSLSFISEKEPDMIIVFGTGIIKKELINLCPRGIINLHGGDPEYYRGLDSHLWAIYHKEFDQLVTTLHRLNPKLDDGEIIKKLSIKIVKEFDIIRLRAENTKICIKLVISAVKDYQKSGKFISYPQKQKGRYYSFMPSCLKNICVKNFQSYVESL